MLKTILDFFRNFVSVTRDVERLQADVKRLEDKCQNLSLSMQRLADENVMLAQREQSARENYQLRLRLELLETEKRLLTAKLKAEEK